MKTFAEYKENRSIESLLESCEKHNISLEPLGKLLGNLIENTDLTDQEIYREFMQQIGNVANTMAKGAGNVVGAVAKGAMNMGKSFAQGAQNTYNAQQTPMNQAQPNQQAGQQPNQPANNQQQPQQNAQQIQQLKTMLGGLNQQNQTFGSTLAQLGKMLNIQ